MSQLAQKFSQVDIIDINKLFGDKVPIVVTVAFKHGLGTALMELNRSVYLNEKNTIPVSVLESIQGLLMSRCENNYCQMMHTNSLVELGASFDEIKLLIEEARLPLSSQVDSKWQDVLILCFYQFRKKTPDSEIDEGLKSLLSENEYQDLRMLFCFIELHYFILNHFKDEVNIGLESILLGEPERVKKLKTYTSALDNGKTEEVYTLCSVCKDIKQDDNSWMPIENFQF